MHSIGTKTMLKINRPVMKENGFSDRDIDTILHRATIMGIAKHEMAKNHLGHLHNLKYFMLEDYDREFNIWIQDLPNTYKRLNLDIFKRLKEIK